MSKIMLITMGTSLFSSASWEFNDWVLAKNSSYEKWKGCIGSPEERGRSPQARDIISTFKLELTDENENEWAEHVASPLRTNNLRYSAELSTLFEMGFIQGNICEFLEGFQKIYLIADPEKRNGQYDLQYIAAKHTKAYLNTLCSITKVDILEIPKLSSQDPMDLFGNNDYGLNLLESKINQKLNECDELTIIASGGYKIYGVLLGNYLYLSSKVSIVYRHEKGDHLIIINAEKIEFSDQISFPNPFKTRQGPV